MAKPQLTELFEWLKENEINRFEIYDVDQNKTLEKCVSYADLTAKGGTPEGYFTQLVNKGVKTVQVVKKRKNGSTYIREGCGLNYGLSTDANNNVAASGSPASPGATPQPYQTPVTPGLMGGASSGMFGLGFSDIMGMRSQSDRFEETKTENRELKSKVERLEAENRKLETECLTYKLGADNKPSAVDKLVEGLAANPTAITAIIQSIKGGQTAPGLNALLQRQLSDTKSMVVELISDNPQITDDHVSAAYYVLVQAVSGNEKFMNEYHSLLTKYNLIPNGGNSDSDSI